MKVDDAHDQRCLDANASVPVRRPRRRAFTLIELLVSLAIILVLLSLLLPAIRSAVSLARARKCQAGQRAVGFDFSIFADDTLHGFRGSDARPNNFTLASYIDAQYQIGDFWAWGNVDEVHLPNADANDPLRCPEVDGGLTLIRGRQAINGGIAPAENISFGFNIRLEQGEYLDSSGRTRVQRGLRLGASILERNRVPLMWDVDAVAATEQGVSPILSGPGLGSNGPLANDRYWFPGRMHHGKTNVLFVDGHVAESAAPLREPDWNWAFSPPAR